MCDLRICTIKQLHWEQGMPQPASSMGYKGKYWPKYTRLSWSIIGGTEIHKNHIQYVIDEIEQMTTLKYVYEDNWRRATIRIQLNPSQGSWSYIGSDALGISSDRPTMNLGWLDADIIAKKYGTVRHEMGHQLGLGHEHLNPLEPFQWVEENVIRDLSGPPNNWDIQTIRRNVLDQVAIDEVDATSLDPDSVMMYSFPGSWVRTGVGTKANENWSKKDIEFIGQLYGKTIIPMSLLDFAKGIFDTKKKVNRLTKDQVIYLLKTLGIDHDKYLRTTILKRLLCTTLEVNP